MEFVKFEPIEDEKCLGIATVKLYEKIVLRYKIIPIREGGGYFPAPASYKLSDDKYIASFMIDSRTEEEEVINMIRENLKQYNLGSSKGECL